ncbi:hypothetical protein VNI00_018733 [Paramarasmius palmivorus]|uniref:Uncharacterized protein n=1 Tax=Paramarasmius palmivorus TaxID=297713 RepID=A0AAW0ATX9_9AGAR
MNVNARLAEAASHLTSQDSLSLAHTFPEWDLKIAQQSFQELGPVSRTHEVMVDSAGFTFERELLGVILGIERKEKDMRDKVLCLLELLNIVLITASAFLPLR